MGMEEFLQMGGYARFVWPSYGLGLAVILWNLRSATRAHARALAGALRQVAMNSEAPRNAGAALVKEAP
jgi:heme exporter protein CcmD